MTHQDPSPQLKIVRSPFNFPDGLNIGANEAFPSFGSLHAKTLLSQSSAFVPVTSNRENPEISKRPTPFLTFKHSFLTISKALDLFKDGVSLKSLGAKYSGTSRSQLTHHWHPFSVIAS